MEDQRELIIRKREVQNCSMSTEIDKLVKKKAWKIVKTCLSNINYTEHKRILMRNQVILTIRNAKQSHYVYEKFSESQNLVECWSIFNEPVNSKQGRLIESKLKTNFRKQYQPTLATNLNERFLKSTDSLCNNEGVKNRRAY